MRWIATQSRLFVCVLCVLLLKMGSTGRTDERVTPIIEFGDAGDQSRILSTHAAVSTIEVPLDHWLGKRVRVHFEAGEWPEIAFSLRAESIGQQWANWSFRCATPEWMP